MYRQDTYRQYSTLFCSILSLLISILLMSFPVFSGEKSDLLAIICPPPVSVAVPSNACEVYVNIPGPMSDDPNCQLTMITNDLTGMNDPSGIYPVSVFTITWEVEDACGADMTCIQTIQVSDVTAPELVCPNGFSTDCVISQEPPYANLSEFLAQSGSMASDNCSLDTLSFGFQGDTLLSGTPCNGVVRRTYMIADPSGNVATCNQLITVMDTEPPLITCPADITVMGTNSDCSADITVSMPVVSDNCLIDNVVNDRNNTNDASGNYPVGTSVVVWTVMDVCGLSASCEMSITVQDASPPTITCPSGVSISCDISNLPPYPDLTAFNAAGGSVSDDCGITQFGLLDEISDGNNCPELVTRIYFVGDANGNQASCNQVISVNDNTPPSFTPPADVSLFCTANIDDLGVTGQISNLNDNCDLSGLVVDYTDNFMPGTCPTQTIVERNWTATDLCGNSHSEIQIISLSSENGPTALCRDITVYLDELGEATTIPDSIDDGSFSDCGGALTFELDINMFLCNDAASSPIEVRLIVIDACDNRDTCFSNVTVSDTLPPELTCPPNDSLECRADVDPSFTSLDMFIAAGGEAYDNCMILTGTFTANAPDTISQICPLTIEREYQLSDIFGNLSVCTQTIFVLDTTAPVIVTCPQDISMNLDPGICSAMVTVDMPQVSDNCGVEQIINDYTNTSDASGIYFAGNTEVLWTVSDSCGNEASCITNITLTGQSPINCPNDTLIFCDISDYPPAASFNDFLNQGGSINSDCGLDTSTFVWVGDTNLENQPCNEVYSRTYIIENNQGTEHQCNQIITVRDTIPPTIQSLNPIVANNDFEICGRDLTIITPSANDNCGGMINLVNSYNGTNDASGFYPVGITTVTWYAEDECGNIDSVSFTVTINDTQAPLLTCPQGITASCSIDEIPPYSSLLEFLAAGGSASDNCELDSMSFELFNQVIMPMMGFSTGNRQYRIFDLYGNSAICNQNILIIDLVPPTIICPENVDIQNDANMCNATANINLPTVDDNCGVMGFENDYTNTQNASGVYPVGTTIVTYTVYDFRGNNATCSFEVQVRDTEAPTTTPADTITTQCNVADVAIWNTVADFGSAGGIATDNCELRYTIDYTGIAEVGQDTFVRTYQVFDIYGNFTEISQVIVVRDDMPPTFNIPMDLTINCNIDVNDLNTTGNVTNVMDNCDNNPSITYSDQVTPDCTNGDLVTRTWTVTDQSGNQTSMIQTIRLIDNEAPIFDMMPSAISSIACDDPFPTPQILTATDNCKMVTITVDTLPYTVNNCTGYTVAYRWTASDECGNSNTTTASFQVLPDTQSPAFDPISNINVSTNSNTCEATVNLSNPTASDNCSSYNFTRIPSGNTFPLGETVITWTATDECNNSSTNTQTITVSDTQSPNLNCQDIQISLTGDLENVQAELIVVSATDNCTNTDNLIIQGRRMQEGCGIGTSDEFDSTFVVCCEDAGTQVTVIIRVTDEAGNFNECMRLVDVKDVQPPVLIDPLPNISVSCEFNFSTSNLSIFGNYRTEDSLRQDIIINDHFYTDTGGFAGRDGLVGDNCPEQLTITESFQDFRVYNQGQIIRTFTVTDASGNSIQLQQTINVIEVDPFDESDITWPPHTDYQSCTPSAPPVSETGEPTWTNKKCAIVGSTYTDWVYTVPGSSCKLVERKWKVVEQAQNLTWEYTQYLTQVNNIAPIISSSCDDITVCANDATCQGNLNITADATDDCTPENQLNWQYQLDIDNDGSINVNGTGKILTSTVPLGTHRVTWLVNDGCGNSSSCSYLITVRDCKDPVARCLHGLSTDLGVMQMAMVWASDFNHYSTDNCTPPDQLRFTFSADPNDDTLNFTCDDLGLNSVDVWVRDLAGNFSVCSTYILITDTGNHCGLGLEDDGYSVNLSGKIYTPEQTKICDAEVYLVGAETSEKQMTDENGVFSFEKLPIFNTYIIQPERDTAWLEGVSTLDLVLIQRHILGIDTLRSPYQYIAADVNNSKSITVSDLIELRKLILGVYKKFPANKSWRFIDVKSEMPNPTNPWPFEEQLVLDNVVTNTDDADFIAVKIGDVSGSVSELRRPNQIQLRKAQSIDLLIGDVDFVQSDEIEVVIYPQENISLCALQFSVFINDNYLKLVDISSEYLPQLGLEHTAFFTENGEQILHVAYHYPFDLAIEKNTGLIKLKFKTLRDGSLNHTLSFGSNRIDAKIYQLDGSYAVPRFRFKNSSTQQVLNVSDGNPNPFREQTQFAIILDKNQMLEISVFDSNGKNLLRKRVSGKKGTNVYTLRAEDISNATGIILVSIKSQDGEKEIKKMLRID